MAPQDHLENQLADDGLDLLDPPERGAFSHVPVLPQEVLLSLNLRPGKRYLDCTVGGGGHSRLMLETRLDPPIHITCLDQDAMALTAAQACLAPWNPQVEFHQINFADFSPALAGASHSHSSGHLYDGILADLGVSSAQFDLGERGFSFRYEAPLDMRMDSRQSLDAAQIINHWEEAELADIFYRYGEERLSRRIARMIVEKRPFATTTQLADAIAGCVPAAYRKGRIHPATRSFQGLRIAVNRELDVLEQWLDQVADWLAPGGRLAVISFHSLEDRLVKHRIKQNPKLQVLTKKPVTAQPEELAVNWRSRSAKLRIAQRLDDRPGALDLEEGEGDRETSEKSWKRKKAATIDWRNGQ